MEITDLLCNYLSDPLGVDTAPRLSWKLQSSVRGTAQTAYQVRAATSTALLKDETGDLWDSGKVVSDRSIHVTYAGKPLTSRQAVFWQVRAWDQRHVASPWSPVARFEMGLLDQAAWSGSWIGSPQGRAEMDRSVPAPHFRITLPLDQKVVEARIYLCGLGFHELFLNGTKAGDAVLAPGFTRYDQRALYQTYDVTHLLGVGENVIGVILGNGWYNGFTDDVWDFRQAPWRDQPKFRLQGYIQLANGQELTLTSGPHWKTAAGPIVFDGLRNGETYDARRELAGWDQAGYDDADWTWAKIVRSPGGILSSEQMPPIRVVDTIAPISMRQVSEASYIFDLGQNISGWVQVRGLNGPSATEVTLRYAEDLADDGSLDTSHIDCFIKSGDFQTDRYILKGTGHETWEPRFVYHGFRYVEISGLPDTPNIEMVRGRIVHTDLQSRGHFTCSDALLNQIQAAARWSTLTNYHSIPTDCPHREKNGWTGDAALSAEQVLMNFNPMAAYIKWMQDFKDVQRVSGQLPGIVPTGGWGYNWGSGPAWDVALFLIPWYLYQYAGDDLLLDSMYAPMKAYLTFALSMSHQGLFDFGLGDWCPPTGGPDGHACPTVVTDTAYVYVMATILSRAAEILGKVDDARCYHAKATEIRDAFRTNFLDLNTISVTGNCQTSTACAIYQGMLEEGEKAAFLKTLLAQLEATQHHLDTGILGAKYVMHVLAEAGRSDVAYAIASQTSFPSWGHWLSQGATTLWEQWDGEGSHNHHMFSDISAWFYHGLAGILPDVKQPGFQHVVFKPQFVPGLEYVEARHESLYGPIGCHWQRAGSRLKVAVTVPANSHGTLILPSGLQDVRETKGGLLGVDIQADALETRLEFGSGEYAFEMEI